MSKISLEELSDGLRQTIQIKQDGILSVNGLDMNNITDTGNYFGYDMTNSAASMISTFTVLRYSVDWIYQEQHVILTGDIWSRVFKDGNTWTPWVRITNMTTEWYEATMVNGFTGHVSYAKLPNNVAVVRLTIHNIPTTEPDTVICTLPVGYRPAKHFPILMNFTNLTPFTSQASTIISPHTGEVLLARGNGLSITPLAGLEGEVMFIC